MKEILKVLKEIMEYVWKMKLYWMVPAVLIFLIIAILLVTTASTAVPVWVYPLV